MNINVAKPYQRGFQTPASPIIEGISVFHDDLRIFLTGILCFVMYIMYACIVRFSSEKSVNGKTQRLLHASVLEVVWTIIPALLLVVIAIPSFSLLYAVDERVEPVLTIKVIGHQWYWSYEFLDPETISRLYLSGTDGVSFEGSGAFDSYMLAEDDLDENNSLKQYRLLSVDNHLFLPARMPVRALVTSTDVLHCWAVPSLGVKLDACPGRLNQTSRFIKREGIYYGQCSEICGVNHGFMPIGIISEEFCAGVTPSSVDFEPLLSALQGSIQSNLLTKDVAEWTKAMDCKSIEIISTLVRTQPSLFVLNEVSIYKTKLFLSNWLLF